MRGKVHSVATTLVTTAVGVLVSPAALAGPDLTVPHAVLHVKIGAMAPGDDMQVDTTIRNAGNQQAPLYHKRPNGTQADMVHWYLRQSGGPWPGTKLAGRGLAGSLQPEQILTLRPVVKIPFSTQSGTHELCVVVDPEQRLPESNESNNALCRAFTVKAPVLVSKLPRSKTLRLQPGAESKPVTPSAKAPGATAPTSPGMLKEPLRRKRIPRPRCAEPPLTSAPRQTAPRNGAVFSHYPRTTNYAWLALRGAARYGMEIDIKGCGPFVNNAFTQWCTDAGKAPLLVKPGLTGTSFTHNFVGAQPGRWRVWAVDSCGRKGPVSGWWTFQYTK